MKQADHHKRTLPSSSRITIDIRENIIRMAEKLSARAKASCQIQDNDLTRSAAAVCAKEVGLHPDKYWDLSQKTDEGPIDVIDMFSGCGGMSAGFKATNGLFPSYRLVLAVDIDSIANKSYKQNLGLEPVTGDISSLASDGDRLRSLVFRAGRRGSNPLVLIGCAPCQGFSSHRNGMGRSDSRNSLFMDFARIAVELMPDAVVIENVPELLTEGNWSYVRRCRKLLESRGYSVHIGVYNMAAFGVPQERFRAVMVALPRPGRPLRGFLMRNQFRTVRDAISGLPKLSPGIPDVTDPLHYTAGHSESTLMTIRAVPKDGGSRPPGIGPQCLARAKERQGRGAYDDVYGRLYWDRPSITITAYARNPASGRFIHPSQDRGLSVREAALLQGFPRRYWFAGSLDQRFRQIGNAVPPQFSSALALHLLGEIVGESLLTDYIDKGITQSVGSSFSRIIGSLKGKSDVTQCLVPLGGNCPCSDASYDLQSSCSR